jgi:hypothetical protein
MIPIIKQIFVLTPWNKAALEKLTVVQLTTDFHQKSINATTFFSHRNPGKIKLHSLLQSTVDTDRSSAVYLGVKAHCPVSIVELT